MQCAQVPACIDATYAALSVVLIPFVLRLFTIKDTNPVWVYCRQANHCHIFEPSNQVGEQITFWFTTEHRTRTQNSIADPVRAPQPRRARLAKLVLTLNCCDGKRDRVPHLQDHPPLDELPNELPLAPSTTRPFGDQEREKVVSNGCRDTSLLPSWHGTTAASVPRTAD
ncbi:hypothetical protein LXA43DRAFT_1094018 [Ganoderma leucocontextum]|nr:hypothetical protein LXA43DRAFT_1094018 [Ganoderma leucocontextum]